MEQLEYLQRYARDLRILTNDTLTDTDRQQLPPAWLDILALTPADRPKATLTLWDNFHIEFEQVLAYLQKNLLGVDVIHSQRGYSLLYAIKAGTGKTMYYEGLLPGLVFPNAAVEKLFAKTPEEFQRFYRELHNGWYYFASRSLGLSPLEDIFVMSDLEWGILEEIGPSPINLDNSLAVYTNGMGGYVCMELDVFMRAHLWFSNQEPELNVIFWSIVDTWTSLGFEG